MAPVIPPSINAKRVPNLSLHRPGNQLNSPATKNAVLMLSSSPCVKRNCRFNAAAYNAKAYDVPPVVAEAAKATTRLGIFEIVGDVVVVVVACSCISCSGCGGLWKTNRLGALASLLLSLYSSLSSSFFSTRSSRCSSFLSFSITDS